MGDTVNEKAFTYEEIAIELLNKKYNDNFEIEEIQSHSFFRGYYTVIAYQEENADLLFRAYVNSDGTGISDNYVTKLVCSDVSDKVARNLDNLKGIYYIFTEVMLELTMLDNVNTSLEEFMETFPNNKFTININYCPEEVSAEEVINALNGTLENLECISGKIHLYIMDEPTLSKVQIYMENHDKCYDEYVSMVEKYSAGIIEFEKGKIKSTKEQINKILENKL